MIFQYQQLARPLVTQGAGAAPDLSWLPSFPDRPPMVRAVARLAAPSHFLNTPPAPIVVPTFWAPTFPSTVPPPGRVWQMPSVGQMPVTVPAVASRIAPRGRPVHVREQQSGRLTLQLVAGDLVTPLPGEVITSLTVTLYAIDQNGFDVIVNSRFRQPILNLNGGALDTLGRLTWDWSAADMAIVTSAAVERHVALIEWGWAGRAGKREILFVIANPRQVP